jgi:molybdopterin/thiamine biosynthesis adenylyltransferase
VNARITMTEQQTSRLRDHFAASPHQQLAFLYAGLATAKRQIDVLVREVRPVDRSELLDGGRHGLELSDGARSEIFSRAAREGHVVIEAHDHGTQLGGVSFSVTDDVGEAEFVPYVRAKLPGLPYGATVWSADLSSVDARVWLPGGGRPVPVDCVRIIGDAIEHIVPTSASRRGVVGSDPGLYSRQILAFGPEGQQRLGQVEVAIVGLGGTGSHVAQQLAYLGVKRFVLIDDDRVERTNLNRLIGATARDVKRHKVVVARRMIRRIARDATATAIAQSLLTERALLALRHVDLMVGCTDTDGSRLVLNELARAYLVPYIDCGTGIGVDQGQIVSIGGRVITVLPHYPCLRCWDQIDMRAAQQELESSQEYELRRQHGYVDGENIPEPSVVTLNGVVASLAAGEALALLTGWRRPIAFQTYYGNRVESHICVPRRGEQNSDCIPCRVGLARGDAVGIERYARRGLPRDLPR